MSREDMKGFFDVNDETLDEVLLALENGGLVKLNRDKKGIALELNCANLKNNKTSIRNLEAMLSTCHRLYVNSDAHTMYEFKTLRQSGFEYLNRNGYLRRIS